MARVLLVALQLSLAATAFARPFTLPGRGAAIVRSDSLRGRAVLVDFWASWCVPCRQSFPWMKSMHEKYGSRGLSIVAINLDKDRAAAYQFLEKFPAPFAVAFDSSGDVAEGFKVSALPCTILMDSTGAEIRREKGFDSKRARRMEAGIQKAIAP